MGIYFPHRLLLSSTRCGEFLCVLLSSTYREQNFLQLRCEVKILVSFVRINHQVVICNRRSYEEIYLCNYILFIFFDLFTQLPVMSTYAESLGASAFLTGLAVGMYSLSNTFGNIISGFF